MKDFEYDSELLTTADPKGNRIFVYPADVKGFFRRQRTRVQLVLILFFLTLPWFKIQGRQALLLNISERKFEFFGLSLRAHNAPLLIFVFASAAFGLFFVTAIFGRIWCGWACPQTVFIDGVFRRFERWIEGPAHERKRLDAASLNSNKFFKKILKWFTFILVTLILTHSFMAYFLGTTKLSQMITHSPTENWPAFIFMACASSLILFNFGWFREQFCTIICPYGRFQSVLMDKSSLVVSYDSLRGEPRHTARSRIQNKENKTRIGDCTNCHRCVFVCPTGIDIRRGVQMECIACTACIDACDDIMAKVKKPPGLIRYASLEPITENEPKINTRAAIYLSLLIISLVSLSTLLFKMKPTDIEVLRSKDFPYSLQTLDDGTIMITNHFIIELKNQSASNQKIFFYLSPSAKSRKIEIIVANQPLELKIDKNEKTDVFIRFPKTALAIGQAKIELLIKDTDVDSTETIHLTEEIELVGPLS